MGKLGLLASGSVFQVKVGLSSRHGCQNLFFQILGMKLGKILSRYPIGNVMCMGTFLEAALYIQSEIHSNRYFLTFNASFCVPLISCFTIEHVLTFPDLPCPWFTVHFCFPPRSAVNRGITVLRLDTDILQVFFIRKIIVWGWTRPTYYSLFYSLKHLLGLKFWF